MRGWGACGKSMAGVSCESCAVGSLMFPKPRRPATTPGGWCAGPEPPDRGGRAGGGARSTRSHPERHRTSGRHHARTHERNPPLPHARRRDRAPRRRPAHRPGARPRRPAARGPHPRDQPVSTTSRPRPGATPPRPRCSSSATPCLCASCWPRPRPWPATCSACAAWRPATA